MRPLIGVRGKLIASLSVLILSYIGLTAYFFLSYQRRVMQEFSVSMYRTLAQTVAGDSLYSFHTKDQKRLFDTIRHLSAEDPNVEFAMFLDLGGTVLIDNEESRVGEPLGTNEVFREALLADGRMYEKHTIRDRVPELDIIVPLVAPVLEIGGTRNYIFPGREGVQVEHGEHQLLEEKLGYYWMRISLRSMMRSLWEMTLIASGLAVGLLVLGAAITQYLVKSFVTPIRSLVDATRNVARGDLGHRVEVVRRDEVGELASAFNNMTARLSGLIDQVREKEKIERELEMAREIQMSLVPREAPVVPGLDITTLFLTFRQVGGDYYDFFHLEEQGKMVMALGDVSGKGMPAAIIMATVRSAVHILIREGKSPVQIMEALNALLCEETKDNEFMSFVIVVVDLESGELVYANAGHLPPIIYRPGSDEVIRLQPQSTLLGVVEGIAFSADVLTLEPGDVMTVFTDGVVEFMDARDREFGEENLIRIMKENADHGSARIMEALKSAMDTYSPDRVFQDDVTIMFVKAGAPES